MALFRRFVIFLAFALMLPMGGALAASPTQPALQIKDLRAGEGEVAGRGARVTVHYTGWLMDGTKFDSSRDRGQPFTFPLGGGQVIPGWDQGVAGMKVGGLRELVIPPELGYGKRGAGDAIPPNATLRFEVELIAITPPKYANVDNDGLAALLSRNVPIVDVRRPDEWKKTGVIAGSNLIMAFNGRGKFQSDFVERLAQVARKDQEVILICRVGNRSRALANALSEKLGYARIYNVSDGIMAWTKAGRPVVAAN